ncbi:MAG TPA: DUF4388 domain-containing protein, partial [Vicinamibacteria bacterium]|nr:DUF4388 domain-containing protein [Vicinamibacteria bacterium]
MAETFPTSGNIDPATFPFLLMDLHRRGATGSLKVVGTSHPKALYFRAGRILFGSSNDPKDQLGSILIEHGKITEEQLDDANAKVGPGSPLAKVLAESGLVNQRELGDAARVKVERILSDVIAYSSGSFEFEDGVLPKGAVDLKLSTEKLLLAAVGRVGDRAFVLRHIESLGVALAPAKDARERAAEMRAEAMPLLDRLDGQRSLKEAADLARLDEFEAAKLACGLLFLGMVARAEPGGAVAAASDELDLAAMARQALGEDAEGAASAPAAAAEAGAAVAAPSADPAASSPPSESPFFVPDEELPRPEPSTEDAGIVFTPPGSATPEPEPRPEVRPEPASAAPAEFLPEMPIVFAAASDEPEAPRFEAAPPAPAFEAPAPFEPSSPMPPFEPPPSPPAPPAGVPPADRSSPRASRLGVETLPDGIAGRSRDEVPTFDDIPAMPRLDEPEDGAITVPPSRPSKEDLAALDALLNPGASSIGAARPAERPRGERWEPQFRPAPRRPTPRQSGFPLVPVALGLAGLAGIAAAGYYFLVLRPAEAEQVATATVPPPSSVPVPPAAPSLETTMPPATLAAPATTRPADPAPPVAAPQTPPPPAGG